MGLFSRLRTPSAGPSSTQGQGQGQPSASRSQTTAPNEGPSLRASSSAASHRDPIVTDGPPTPRAKERRFGWTGKGKADVVSGKPYEEQEPVQAGLAERRNRDKRITAIYTPASSAGLNGNPPLRSASSMDISSPTSPYSPMSDRSDRTIQSGGTERGPVGLGDTSWPRRRPMSNEFAQDGGVLGRLMFEKSIPRVPGSELPERKSREPSWLVGNGSQDEFRLSLGSSPPRAYKSSYSVPVLSPSRRSGERRRSNPPQIPIRQTSFEQNPANVSTEDGSAISDTEQEELAGDGQRKGRFWKGKGRKLSKGVTEAEEAAPDLARPPLSPRKQSHGPASGVSAPSSPRVASLPLPTQILTNPVIRPLPDPPHHALPLPRPRAQSPGPRRPSSSFFSNPFTRTTSRGSILTDLEIQPGPDDGSFQLKSFRHVSGMSDAGGSGLDSYFGNTAIDLSSTLVDSPAAASPLNLVTDKDKWDLPPPVRPNISRPPSSASLRTLDSPLAESPKVSVAAFKKGIRRPSETVLEGSRSALDDDDDVPLAVLNKGFARVKSSLSLSDQAQAEIPPIHTTPASPVSPAASLNKPLPPISNAGAQPTSGQISATRLALSQPSSRESSPVPSPNSGTSAQGYFPGGVSHRRNGGGSGGFVVRSAHSNRTMPSPEASRPNGAASPPPRTGSTGPTSPLSFHKSRDHEAEPEEVMISPVESHAPLPPARPTSIIQAVQVNVIGPTPIKAVLPGSTAGSPMVERDVNVPAASSASYDTSKALAKVVSSETPPAMQLADVVISPRTADPGAALGDTSKHHATSAATSTSVTFPASQSMTSFFAPSSPGKEREDGFDPALISKSMAVFADEPTPIEQVKKARPSLQDRLGQVAGVAPTKTASDVPTSTSKQGLGQELADDAIIAAIVLPDPAPVSSFIRPTQAKATGRGRVVDKKKAWSSSESEGEEEDAVRSPSRQVRSTSFLNQRPGGPRVDSSAGRAITPLPPTSSKAPEHGSSDDDSSSEEETLATIRAKASMSSLALNTFASKPSSGPISPQRGLRSPSESHLALSPPKSIFRRPSKTARSISSGPKSQSSFVPSPRAGPQSLSPTKTGASAGVLQTHPQYPSKSSPATGSTSLPGPNRRSPLSQSHSSFELSQSRRLVSERDAPTSASASASVGSMSAQASASPASSQSGLTGDSIQLPVTPKDATTSGMATMPGGKAGMHTRGVSRDSQPWSAADMGQGSSSTSMASVSPSVEERQRRYSQVSTPQLQSQPTGYSQQAQQAQAMDQAAIRNMMKQQWQAQFVAAAYQAAEEQWERASSVGGLGSDSGQPQANQYSPFPMGMLPMPIGMQGMGLPGMPPMPYGYGFPSAQGQPFMSPQQSPFGLPPMPQQMAYPAYSPYMPQPQSQQSTAGMGMYNYTPGSQSVYGGDFGPPAQTSMHLQHQQQPQHQQQQFPFQPQFQPVSGSSSPDDNARPPAPPSAYISSPLSRPIQDLPSTQPLQPRQHPNSRSTPGVSFDTGVQAGQPRPKDRSSSYHANLSSIASSNNRDGAHAGVAGSPPRDGRSSAMAGSSWRKSGDWDTEGTLRRPRTHFAS